MKVKQEVAPVSSPTSERVLVPPPVSNLQRIREVLMENSRSLFVAGSSSYYNPDGSSFSEGEPLTQIERDITNHPTIVFETFYVAPPKNGEFNTDRLEKLRKKIGKVLSPLALNQPLSNNEYFNQLRYGYIACDDILARVAITTDYDVEEIEPGILEKLQVKPGKTSSSDVSTIERRVLVRFLPHPMLAIIVRNEVPNYFYSDKQLAEDLGRGISQAQLRRLRELLQEKYPNPKHILYELVMTAKAEEYRRQETEIQKFWEITGR